MTDNLKEQLKALIIDKLGLEDITPADIGDDTALFADDGLGLDSVDALELGLAIQKAYNFPMENDAQTLRDHFYSVNTLAAWIETRQGQAHAG
ncbi:phosphopantetheine-binding protein [uncultured Cardiobacterium sp.]|uniref:phosphopantetheine-binding protein n=1 Tax=uncultured Cardiobacterium sp. TaxID=417619 RepID=UPI002613FC6C|nr:phosphopantetheine-binding protein [uncultured Cardiobacterium sp.]